MKKEVFVAIFIGLSVGLLVTFGVYTARKTFSPSGEIPSPSPSALPSGNPNNNLRLTSPEDETIQNTKEVRVAGVTDADAVVAIFINERPFITRADQNGNFAITSDLDDNSNVIRVTSVDEDGNVAETDRTVIYSIVNLTDQTTSDSLEASSSATTKKPSPKPSASPVASPKATPKVTPAP
jgi:hypothetical protein